MATEGESLAASPVSKLLARLRTEDESFDSNSPEGSLRLGEGVVLAGLGTSEAAPGEPGIVKCGVAAACCIKEGTEVCCTFYFERCPGFTE
jgi:hypothetical protein